MNNNRKAQFIFKAHEIDFFILVLPFNMNYALKFYICKVLTTVGFTIILN